MYLVFVSFTIDLFILAKFGESVKYNQNTKGLFAQG